MQEFEIVLKIKSLSGIHNEYKWEGKTMRSSRENPILLMKAEDELDAYDKIKALSEGTLEIVSIVKAEDGDQKYVQQMVDLALLSQNMLTGEKLSDFVKRSIELMN